MATLVLVPGAWLGSWVWKKVIPVLQKNGHLVYPVTLTGMGERVHLAREEYGIETAIQDVINIIEYEDLKNVILVGHSFAGKVISAVYDRIPDRISTLLFLDALVPQKTRKPQGGIESMSHSEIWSIKKLANEHGEGWKIPLGEEDINTLCFDLKGKDRDWFMSKVTPWPTRLAFDPVVLSEKVDRAKKAYIFCIKEGEEFDDSDRKFLQSLDGVYKVIKTDHFPMINKPEELVSKLEEVLNT
ncbi:MAG: alpha/beta fold hydrolase [Thermoplasmataceae archaeon]